MNAQLAPEDVDTEAAPESARALLRSVVIADLCDSTALVDRLGDSRAAELIRAHDRLLRALIREHGGQEIDKTDGFLSLFERPIEAVGFALAYQRGLRAFSLEHGVELKARIGVHVGEVMTWQNDEADVAKGAKPTEVEGLAKPVAARLMGMALPGQILLSGVAYTLAHRAEGELGAALARVQWKPHGLFRFKGVAEAVPVYEIGEGGIAPFKSPAWSGKAHREVPLWRRPAVLAFELLALLALIALPAWHFLKPEPAIAFAERDWVVLADLRNLTGDPRFDDSLEQAFRIGLEQSRHVNVLSDLQVRDTLQRMQRDSDSPVDRSIGAEIAMREGARALVLPTLAEVGGRLRFTAEIIHPNTQATVYSEYADGRGAEAVLPLVDEVNRKLRERLGEAVAQVETDTRPLEKVATANMDALRAYTRALELANVNQTRDAMALLANAIAADPGFARARLELARRLIDNGEEPLAIAELRKLKEDPSRLTQRELDHARALLTGLTAPVEASLDAWRQFHLQYPDYFPASGYYAWAAWALDNDYATALSAIELNVAAQNPRRANGLYLKGALLLGANRPIEALASFREAQSSGAAFENRLLSFAHLAAGESDLARKALADGVGSGTAVSVGSAALAAAALRVESGEIAESALSLLELAARSPVNGTAAEIPILLAAIQLAAVPREQGLEPSVVRAAIERMQELLAPSSELLDSHELMQFELGLVSALIELDEVNAASSFLDQAKGRLDSGRGGFEVKHRLLLAEASLQLARGDADAAAARIESLFDGRELVASRVLAMRARRAAGQPAQAAVHARWLVGNRGRGLAEPQAWSALQPYNFAWSLAATLELAELEASLGNNEAALEMLGAWPPERAGRWQQIGANERLAALRLRLQPSEP
jgi:putative peptide modification system cyclase